jgi:hypothetical protein
MKYPSLIALAVVSLLWQVANADGSYEETNQVTGGAMKQIISMGGQFSPSASNSMQKANSVITVVKGNRMARITPNQTMVWDLEQGIMTRIDNQKKQYAVATFDEVQQMAQKQAQQMQQLTEERKGDIDQAQQQLPKELSDNPTSFDSKVEETGATKTIEGTPAHQVVLTESMTFHSKDSNDTVSYYFKNDVWLANSTPPGWEEIAAFKKHLAEKMAGNVQTSMQANPITLLTATRPGLAEGLKKMGEAQKKQQGVPVMVVQQLGGHAEGSSVTSATASSANLATGGQASSMTNEVISSAASNAAGQEASQLTSSSKLGILGSSLASAAAGVFQHHSANLTKSATSSATNVVSSSGSPSGKPASVDRVMAETTTVTSNFSTESVPEAAFAVPSGYAKVAWQGPMTAPKH